MYTFDYFVGELKCHTCGKVSNSDESTNMQTKILKNPKMAPYGVGDALDFDVDGIENSGYLCINNPTQSNEISIIESWDCPNCDKSFNWAKITVINGVIHSIQEIELSEYAIRNNNYISEDCGYFGWQVKHE